MPRRNDSLPKPDQPVGFRIDLDVATRDRLRVLAAERGYSMSALVRLLIEEACQRPEKHLKGIPKNPR